MPRMMFGPKISTVFTSRWKALGWAAGVMFTAYGIADSMRGEDAGASAAAMAPMMGAPASESASSSPWAADGGQGDNGAAAAATSNPAPTSSPTPVAPNNGGPVP